MTNPGRGLRGIAQTIALAGACLAALACNGAGGSAGATGLNATVPPVLATAAASLAAGGGTAAVCRDLKNLKSLDYAFGASFSVIQSLDAASKARTIQDLATFAAEAPPELQPVVTDLAAFWTALAANPSSVTESDPRLTGAAQTLGAWLTANCP